MQSDEGRLTVGAIEYTDEGSPSALAYRLTARGEIDAQSAPILESALDGLIEGGAAIVVLDAADVEFMDSSGIRALVTAGSRLSDTGGRLFIEGMSGAVQRVLEVSGLIDRYTR
jgi:anti-sigma B factor antagonist